MKGERGKFVLLHAVSFLSLFALNHSNAWTVSCLRTVMCFVPCLYQHTIKNVLYHV